MSSLVRDLTAVVGSAHVLTTPDLLAGYITDWTRRYTGPAVCAVRPATTAEVAEVLRCCQRHGAGVVPQGGNTGLVGGSVPPPAGPSGEPARACVLLSVARMDQLDPVDTLAAQVTAGAGVSIARLRAHAAAAGLEYEIGRAHV